MSGSVLFDVPGPRARIRNWIVTAVTVVLTLLVLWVVYGRLDAKNQLDAEKWEPFLTANLWKTYIWPGIEGTLTAAAVSIVLALALGIAARRGPAVPYRSGAVGVLRHRGVLPRRCRCWS